MNIIFKKIGEKNILTKSGKASKHIEGIWQWGADPTPGTILQFSKNCKQ